MSYFLISLNNLRDELSALFLPSPNHFIPPPVCSDLVFTYSLVIRFLGTDNDTPCPLPSLLYVFWKQLGCTPSCGNLYIARASPPPGWSMSLSKNP